MKVWTTPVLVENKIVSVLKERKIQNIRYTKPVNVGGEQIDEVTERVVIPTFIPKASVKAVDVTDLSEEKREELQQLLTEYNEYVRERSKAIFKFEDWVEHTKLTHIDVKWRTFKINNTEVL